GLAHASSGNGGAGAPGNGGFAAPRPHTGKRSTHVAPDTTAPVKPPTDPGLGDPGVRIHGHPATGGSTPVRPPATAPAPCAPAPSAPPVRTPGFGGSVADLINSMIAEANRITAHHYAYSWGGGHNPSFSGPYDCSGAVSAVLHAAGLLDSPRVSGGFMHWGAPGRGAVTLYANAGHVYMSILGHFFGTSGANPGGGAGWFNGG